ncbi:hypothetical protein [Flavobacterium cyanobacteriorum]|uniref:hypothetical protein n=1 Tax=Flavobacterium cyanobacteriorum TaxID=2022802 RepID=UPI00101AD5C9|nr:hypothetical protein [Flavobacterium cyanobacteriorum]
MKPKRVILITFFLLLISLVIFCWKTYIEFSLVCQIPSIKEFRPDGYVFIHSEDDLTNYSFINKQTNFIKKHCENVFDFSQYSYVIIYGRKPQVMYYSYKNSFFEDTSEPYAKYNDKTVVFIHYEDKPKETGTFIYKIKKNSKLRGFYGN